nr:hypothetical protein [Tanacetum cinerariifolium]
MILESFEHDLLIWPTIKENSMTRTKKYEELSATEKIQVDYNLKATNIILQGLPSDVYSLVNHYIVSNDLWEKVQLLIQENSMTRTKKYEELSATEKIQVDYNLKATNIILQGLPSDVYSLVNHYIVSNDLWEKVQLLIQVNQQTHLAEFPQIDSSLADHVFKQGDDPIDAINKMMSFLSIEILSRFFTTNNQLRNSSNAIQQANIHDRRVTVQPVQGRQSLFAAGTSRTRANISGIGRNNSGKQRVVKCFNCQGEAQRSGKVLNKEELDFLADPGVTKGPVTQTVITHNVAYQVDDLDAYDSDCDDFSTAKAVLMANLSSYGSDVLFKIRPMLYDCSVIAKETNVISIADSEETLMLEEESRSKMLLKQSDPKVLEKKFNIKPINCAELNRLSEDFGNVLSHNKNCLMNKLFGYKLHILILTNLLLLLSKLRLLGNFLSNDLEYLRGGASSRKYTSSVTKTKATDYEHIKWIEDLVPRTPWSQEPVSYDKHALWGISHWGRKRQQFYGFPVNRESARDPGSLLLLYLYHFTSRWSEADTASEFPLDDHPEPLPVDWKSIELLTFTPPMRYSSESMFVIAYWFLTPWCARHQPLDNLEFSDSDDSTLRINITSRLPVNSKTVELLMFTPPMGDSPEGMLVVAYWFLNSHCPRHQVFNPLDVPVICCFCLGDRSSILAA